MDLLDLILFNLATHNEYLTVAISWTAPNVHHELSLANQSYYSTVLTTLVEYELVFSPYLQYDPNEILGVYPNELYHLGWMLKISTWNVHEIFINPPFSTMRWSFHPVSTNQIAAIFTIVVQTNVKFSKSWQTASPHYHIIMYQYYNVTISQNKILQYLPCCRDNVKFGKSWQLGLATWLRLCSFRLLQYQIHIYQIYSQQSFTFNVLSLSFLFYFFFPRIWFITIFRMYFAV